MLKKLILGTALATSAMTASAKELMTIVTTDQPQSQMMAMVLSVQSMKQGHKVSVLLCDKGADLALKNSTHPSFKPAEKSPQQLLKMMMSKGVSVGVCPLYLPNSSHTKADLLDGINVVKPPQMAEQLMRDDVKVLTY